MTLSQAFEQLEERNGRGSTTLLASFNNRGNDTATIDTHNTLYIIRVRGDIAGISRGDWKRIK